MLPEVMAIAGPNGSGKTTVTALAQVKGLYINADEIKRATGCEDMDAALRAEELREQCLREHRDFTFETVLSTPRNLELLRRARKEGFFVRCVYVLTADADINIVRVRARLLGGGHGVPEDKIRSRYRKALALVPDLISVCDIIHIYDNSGEAPFRIFKKRKTKFYAAENEFWNLNDIETLTGIASPEPFPHKPR